MIQPRTDALVDRPERHDDTVDAEPRTRRLTIITFGFKYGLPGANYYFDVSFLRNPAREPQWGLFSKPCAAMRRFVMDQPEAVAFLDRLDPLVRLLLDVDDDVRIGIGCSSGRHRSYIMAELLKQRLEDDHTHVKLVHREEQYQ